MAETQRYPWDFNGVIAGSPAFAIAEAMERFIWEARWGRDDRGVLVFDSGAATLLHEAVINACDLLDGARDGQIDDPRRCHFDPRSLICRPGQSPPECLTALQAEVAQKFYDGPVDGSGRHLFYGGEPYGSELSWLERYALAAAGSSMFDDAVRNMMFQGSLDADASVRTWRFDLAAFRELSRRGALFDASSPDLRAFAGGGGKLILWQGFADPAAGAYGLPDYYQQVGQVVGGLELERQFARMFLIPGVYHCGGGYVPYEEDFLGALVNWVERGAAPDQIMAAAVLTDGAVRRRPVFAYPVQTRYRGRGGKQRSIRLGRGLGRALIVHAVQYGAHVGLEFQRKDSISEPLRRDARQWSSCASCAVDEFAAQRRIVEWPMRITQRIAHAEMQLPVVAQQYAQPARRGALPQTASRRLEAYFRRQLEQPWIAQRGGRKAVQSNFLVQQRSGQRKWQTEFCVDDGLRRAPLRIGLAQHALHFVAVNHHQRDLPGAEIMQGAKLLCGLDVRMRRTATGPFLEA
jgi:hypothetical protein